MAWFVAVLVFECSVEGTDELKFDKQIRLVRAGSAEEAYTKALKFGAEEIHSYQNSAGQDVSWYFMGLNDLAELIAGEPHDGAEIYSCLGGGSAAGLVVAKEELTAFWYLKNLDKASSEFLSSGVKPFSKK